MGRGIPASLVSRYMRSLSSRIATSLSTIRRDTHGCRGYQTIVRYAVGVRAGFFPYAERAYQRLACRGKARLHIGSEVALAHLEPVWLA